MDLVLVRWPANALNLIHSVRGTCRTQLGLHRTITSSTPTYPPNPDSRHRNSPRTTCICRWVDKVNDRAILASAMHINANGPRGIYWSLEEPQKSTYSPLSFVVSNDYVSPRARIAGVNEWKRHLRLLKSVWCRVPCCNRITPLLGALTARCVKRHALLQT